LIRCLGKTQVEVSWQKRYGKVIFTFKKVKGSKSKLLEVNYNVPDEMHEEAATAYHQIGLHSAELQKNDLKKAFALMAENIWTWWD